MIKSNKIKIKEIADKLGEIFDSLNSSICCDCPRAIYYDKDIVKPIKTVKDVNKMRYGFCSKEAGCFSKCTKNNGYFQYIKGDQSIIVLKHLKAKYNFSKIYGFFDNEKKTCKLPREKRSLTCLWFSCGALKISQETYKKIRKLSNDLREIKYTSRASLL